MTTLSANDVRERPGEFFIVARSARGHAHIPVDDFDTLLDGIWKSANTAVSSDEDMMRIIQALMQKIDAMDAEIAFLKASLEAINDVVVPASIE